VQPNEGICSFFSDSSNGNSLPQDFGIPIVSANIIVAIFRVNMFVGILEAINQSWQRTLRCARRSVLPEEETKEKIPLKMAAVVFSRDPGEPSTVHCICLKSELMKSASNKLGRGRSCGSCGALAHFCLVVSETVTLSGKVSRAQNLCPTFLYNFFFRNV
jgi:hypothetical protein